MTESETRRFLPDERGALHVFDRVKAENFLFTDIEDFQKDDITSIQRAVEVTKLYFLTGIAYLQHYSEDPDLAELATTTLQALATGRIGQEYHFGIHFGHNFDLEKAWEEEGYLPTDLEHDGTNLIPQAKLGFSPTAVIKAQKDPLVVMERYIAQMSLISDVVNGKIAESPERVLDRMGAYQAQFWHHVHRKNPQIQLSGDTLALMDHYPDGLGSLSKERRYSSRFPISEDAVRPGVNMKVNMTYIPGKRGRS